MDLLYFNMDVSVGKMQTWKYLWESLSKCKTKSRICEILAYVFLVHCYKQVVFQIRKLTD